MPGTIVETAYMLGTVKKIEFACTAGASDALFPEVALTQKIDGFLLMIETNPGATGPTTLYDIAIDDEEGIDVLQTAGADRHISNSEVAAIPFGTYFHPPITQDQTLTLKITNNIVNSATTKIILYWSAVSG